MASGFREGQPAVPYRTFQKCPGQVAYRGKVGKVGSRLEKPICPLTLNRTVNQEIPCVLEDSRLISAAVDIAWLYQCFSRDHELRTLPEFD